MLHQIKQYLQSRQHAGRLLAEKLRSIRLPLENSIVLAIPRGGVPVGKEVAMSLEVPFEIIFSKRIRHPAHSDQSIGAVSRDEVVLHETTHFIPQTYLLSQVTRLQHDLQQQFEQYHGRHSKKSLKNKTVILVDDVLRDTDEVDACLHSIARQDASKVIVAAPVVGIRVINYLADENIDCHFLFTELHQSKAGTYFPTMAEGSREVS